MNAPHEDDRPQHHDATGSAPQRLAESDERYRLLAETMPHGVVHHGPDGRIIEMNPAAERILGRPRERLLGSTSDDQAPNTVREDGSPFPADQHPTSVVLRTGLPVRGVVMGVINAETGTRRWIRIDAVPLHHKGDARSMEVYALFEDITERKALDDALLRSEAHFRSLAENIPDVHLRFDLVENRVVYVSPSCEAVLGYTVEEIMRSGPSERGVMIDADYMETVTAALERVSREGRGEFEFRAASGSGESRWYWAVVVLVPDPDGHVRFRDSIIRDITDRKSIELALQEADEQKNRFVATLAHELRNPLAPLVNAILVLQRPNLPDAQREWCVGVLGRQVELMGQLVDDLLDLSAVKVGKVTLHRTMVDLRTVVQQAIEMARSHIAAKQHELTVTAPVSGLFVDGDSLRLSQVCCNLLTNAAKYTDAGGSIAVELERDGAWAVMRVRDNGIGLDVRDVSKLFVVFGQIETSRHRAGSGLGIGLSLVKGMVELHGGEVIVHSDGAGLGSTFEVRLPSVEKLVEVH